MTDRIIQTMLLIFLGFNAGLVYGHVTRGATKPEPACITTSNAPESSTSAICEHIEPVCWHPLADRIAERYAWRQTLKGLSW